VQAAGAGGVFALAGQVADAVADQRHGEGFEVGDDDLAELAGGNGVIVLVENFDDDVFGGDVEIALGAGVGEQSAVATAVLDGDRCGEGLFDEVAVGLKEDFAGDENDFQIFEVEVRSG